MMGDRSRPALSAPPLWTSRSAGPSAERRAPRTARAERAVRPAAQSPRPTAALLVALCLSAAPLAAQAPALPLPAAPHARTAVLTPEPGYFTEPSIAVDPTNPDHVVAAWQDNAHAAWSTDGGRTWTTAEGTEPPDYRVSGDVSVAIDRHGHAFLCYMAFDHLGTTSYWAHGATRNGIFVRRSLDGGRTWEPDDRALDVWPTRPGIPWEDKPYLVVDNSGGPRDGTLYVGWTEFTLDHTVILLSHSADDGKTWSAPVTVSTRPGLPRDDNGALEGFSGAVGPDGTLYLVWTNGDAIVFTASHDGGATFEPEREAIHTAPAYFEIANFTRGNGFPQIAVDPRAGARGRLFVTWSDFRNGDIDVFASTSDDGGRTWTPAARVNDDPPHDGRDQFFQWLAVDPRDGAASVVFYDRRADSSNVRPTVTVARSTDGGVHWRDWALSDSSFDPRRAAFLGDYSGIAALDGRVYAIWTEEAPTPPPAPASAPIRRRANSIIRVGTADFGGD